MSSPKPRSLAATVQRYLEALGGAASTVRRRERTHCLELQARVAESGGALDKALLESWIEPMSREARTVRLTTVRRLLALTPGADAGGLAAWVDANRDRLVVPETRPKVVALRPRDRGAEARALAGRLAQEATALYDSEQRGRARAVARRALREDPCCMEAHSIVGTLYLEEDRPELALRQFRQALVLGGDPAGRKDTEGIARVLDGLGRTLLYVDCVDEAFEVYRRLRFAGPKWALKSAPMLGRSALLMDEPQKAAEYFAAGEPIEQYSVLLARSILGDKTGAAVAFLRGLLANPFLPATLLPALPHRFEDAFCPEAQRTYQQAALAYTRSHRDLFAAWPEPEMWLHALWEHPKTRAFLIRVVPVLKDNPSSPKLAVWVHKGAKAILADWGLADD